MYYENSLNCKNLFIPQLIDRLGINHDLMRVKKKEQKRQLFKAQKDNFIFTLSIFFLAKLKKG